MNTAHNHTVSDYNYKILVVDDIEINFIVLENFLKFYDAKILHASDGKKAVQLFQKENFSMVFMDIQMPVMDGFEATTHIRDYEKLETLQPTPIIAVTAHIKPTDQHLCLKAGMNDYLHKPIKMDDICNRMKIWAPQVLQKAS